MLEQTLIRGGDSSTFTQISVEQKLKSMVDDDHFRGKTIDKTIDKKKTKKQIRVPIWFVRILSWSQFVPRCVRALHCCSGFQKWPRERTFYLKNMKLCGMILSFSAHV